MRGAADRRSLPTERCAVAQQTTAMTGTADVLVGIAPLGAWCSTSAPLRAAADEDVGGPREGKLNLFDESTGNPWGRKIFTDESNFKRWDS